MSFPVTIEGKRYFVCLPTLQDFEAFRAHRQREHRRAGYEAIPAGLPDTEFQRWKKTIDDECEAIDPFESFAVLAGSAATLPIIWHAMLRHENQGIDLAWCDSLLRRAADGDTVAVEGLRELRQAMDELVAAKKNEQAEQRQAVKGRPKRRPTLAPSTSH